MRLARTPGPCAWGFGVLGLLGGSALAAPTPSTSLETTVEVRVNDQRSKRLLEPWITVELESGEMVAARALDDGVDPGDRFANDRIYIARLHFAGAGRGRLYLTNGEKQPGTDLCSMGDQTLRRPGIATDRGNASAKNAGFLAPDSLAVRAK